MQMITPPYFENDTQLTSLPSFSITPINRVTYFNGSALLGAVVKSII